MNIMVLTWWWWRWWSSLRWWRWSCSLSSLALPLLHPIDHLVVVVPLTMLPPVQVVRVVEGLKRLVSSLVAP